MRHYISILLNCKVLIFIVHGLLFADTAPLAPRIPVPLHLAKLSLMNDSSAIRISKEGDLDYALIGMFDDLFLKNTNAASTRTTYRESIEQAHALSDFEARNITLATRSLIETLEEFERFLQQKKWGQCLYLDGYFPRFLKNYYLLLGISRSNSSKFTHIHCLFDKRFDVSLSSPLSDQRIDMWKNDEECQMKLRIASKELIHQLRLWDKRELSNSDRNPEISFSNKVEETLELFIKIYFGIKSSGPCEEPRRGRP